MDFDDLLLLAVQLLQENDEIRENIRTAFNTSSSMNIRIRTMLNIC